MTEPVLRTERRGVAVLTLNRPEKLNALNRATFAALHDELTEIATNPAVGCVVLTGSGRAFSAGNDLDGIGSPEDVVADRLPADTIDLLEALPQPTIAKINGFCFTGALELALACDLLVCGRSAKLGDTHAQWGMSPLWGMSVRLPERVGRARAKELMFTARRLDGIEAAAIGLVDRCTEDELLDEEVERLAASITANSWGSHRNAKALLGASSQRSRSEALAFERTLPFGFPDDMAERMTGVRSG